MFFLPRIFRLIAGLTLIFVSTGLFFLSLFVFKTGNVPSQKAFLQPEKLIETVFEPVDKSCRFPIAYRVGSIDPSFHISQEEVSLAIVEAKDIWEQGLDRTVFVHSDDEDAMPINLVFDSRQKTTDASKTESSAISEKKSIYDAMVEQHTHLRSEFDRIKSEYEKHISKYQKQLHAYELRVGKYEDDRKAYEAMVMMWNAKGGAPPDEFKELEDMKKSLKKQADALEDDREDLNDEKDVLAKQEKELNASFEEVNTLAGKLNRLASELNIKVDSYNEVFGFREEFTTGLYVEDVSGTRIDVFQFYDHDDLVLILAHEMGHALGLDHEEVNPASILYPSIGKQSHVLTDDDRKIFDAKCPKK